MKMNDITGLTVEDADLFLDLLDDLDNPENMVYKSFFHMMEMKPYMKFIQGKSPDGRLTFKFVLNPLGEDLVKQLKQLKGNE